MQLIAADGEILNANRNLLELLGYDADDYAGRNLRDIWGDGESLEEALAALRRGETLHLEDASIIGADGTRRYVTIDANCSTTEGDGDGDFLHSNWFIRPRSVRSGSVENDEWWYSLLEAIPASVSLGDSDGEVRYWNRSFREYTGLTIEQARQSAWELVHPDDLPNVSRLHSEAISHRRPAEIEYRLRGADGQWRWHLSRTAPIPDGNGGIKYWLGVSVDIDDRRRAEKALRQSERRFRQIVETANEGVLMLDQNACISYVNDRLAEMLRYERDELVGRHLFDFLDDDGRRTAQQKLERRRSGVSEQFDFRLKRKDGRDFFCIVSAAPMVDVRGQYAGSIAMITDVTRRVRAEHAVAQNLDLYRTIADRLPAMIVLRGPDGRIAYCNRRLLDYFGVSEQELIEHDWFSFVHPDDQGVAERWRDIMRTGEPGGDEYQARRHDGTYRWHLARIEPVRNDRGDIEMWIGAHVDVHDRKLAEEALSASEQRFRQLADAMPQVVWTARADGEVDFYNRRWYEFVGHDGSEDAVRDWRSVLHPDDQQRCLDAWHASVRTGEPYEIEYRFRNPVTGEYHWQLGRALAARDESGTIVRWYGTSTDIHDQKEVQALLAARERQQESIANLGLAAMSEMPVDELLDLAAQEVAAGLNVEYAKVLELLPDGKKLLLRAGAGWPPGVVGNEVVRVEKSEGGYALQSEGPVIVRDLGNETRFEPSRLLADHGVVSGLTVVIRLRNGNYGTLGAHSCQEREFTLDDVHFLQAMANLIGNSIERERDEASLMETADQLREAVAAKDEFLGLVSHELKTPITTIFGNAEVLHMRGERLGQEVRHAAIEDVRNEAERLHRIVDNLLVLARMERGQRPDAEPVLMRQLVQTLVNDHTRRFPHREINVQVQGGSQPIMGEPVYLEQIVRNLLSNAEKYSPPQEPIDVKIFTDDEELRLSVLDRGPGVPDEEAERIFAPFYRASSTSSRAGGIGIGLAVCKRLVEAQNGRMWANRRPEGGSDIGFAVPVLEEDEV